MIPLCPIWQEPLQGGGIAQSGSLPVEPKAQTTPVVKVSVYG